MSRVDVLPIPRGSLVILHDVRLDDPQSVAEAVRKAAGHDEFALLCTEGSGRVQVISDPDKFPEWLARRLASAGSVRAAVLAKVRPSGPAAPSEVRAAASLRR